MRKGDTGHQVATLQRELVTAGFKLTVDGWFGAATEAAVKALQQRAGLVVDGIAGPKTQAALYSQDKDKRTLAEADLIKAAERLGIGLAAIKAVNEVETTGHGFLSDGRPVILYERHKAFGLLGESGVPAEDAIALATRYPNLVNEKRGGYAGGHHEWSRLNTALTILPPAVAYGACSWGQYQVMGYHWQRLGYASIDEFVFSMKSGEAGQLEAFVRYLEAEPALIKALKAGKWADFARGYNGPAYKDNAYDIKLARAYERYAEADQAEAA
ncbi:N-acetylmuramidase family protein [Azonexus sp. R2A61]|uniref:N-acetylmuramidase domain-containing protein n=1 Tax=Azonexus sp. R2A61 TaxID=2744443 RepID=UPI001F3BF4AF|nr:N-acetylmuramidase family protein [Azonexus sp. R2A61]